MCKLYRIRTKIIPSKTNRFDSSYTLHGERQTSKEDYCGHRHTIGFNRMLPWKLRMFMVISSSQCHAKHRLVL